MKQQILKRVKFEELVERNLTGDHLIGEDIILIDEYRVDPIYEYEFVARGNYFIEVLEGNGFIEVNGGGEHSVDGHCLLIYLKGQTIRASIKSRRTVQRGLEFSDTFMESLYQSAIKFNDIRSSVIENPVLVIDDEIGNWMDIYVRMMRAIAYGPFYENKLACARFATLTLFYGPLNRLIGKKIEAETFRSPKLSSMFFSLLEKNFKQQHKLAFYADALNISVQYLYVSVVSTTGKSPGYWVDYYLVSEAKKLLGDWDVSILQISQWLNFAGLPQFGKFFRKQTGMSPRAFRKSLSSDVARNDGEFAG